MSELILGIETSCDDTAIALVSENGDVISSVISSQIEIHNEYGGVYPEFAAREHIQTIIPTVKAAFDQAKISPKDIKGIGVTRGPGLVGSLLVGINTAIGLGHGWNKPVIGVNHLRGHLRSADLEEQRVKFPAMVLLVSGGHTFLAYMKNPMEVQVLSSTRDDSVGECFDKVGRMLGLDYPGGPKIDKLAQKGKPTIPFPRPMMDKGLEFSFSGLKAAVSRLLAATDEHKDADVATSFVQAIVDVLVKKSERALKKYPSKSFVIVGGVAANSQIRAATQKLSDKMGVELCLPPIKWATDNGAMIALATWDYFKAGIIKPPKVQLNLTMSEF